MAPTRSVVKFSKGSLASSLTPSPLRSPQNQAQKSQDTSIPVAALSEMAHEICNSDDVTVVYLPEDSYHVAHSEVQKLKTKPVQKQGNHTR